MRIEKRKRGKYLEKQPNFITKETLVCKMKVRYRDRKKKKRKRGNENKMKIKEKNEECRISRKGVLLYY